MTETLLNWSGNLQYQAARIHRPGSVEEVRSIVAGATKLRALGSRHSFNEVADTPDDLVSLERLNRIVGLDRGRGQVTIEGGVRYGDLGRYLHGEGFALHNLGSLPHISVAGASATGTHGSGVRNGNLATAVAAVEFVSAGGELVRLSREDDPETFPGAVISIGALGPVVSMTLNVRPTFEVAQRVYEGLPLAALEGRFDEIAGAAYSVSLFTHWRESRFEQVWLKRNVTEDRSEWPETFHGAAPADGPRHPIAHMSPVNCTPQLGVPGPWDERLPHFKYEFTPSSGEELQSEYHVPRHHAYAALQALDAISDRFSPLVQISEIRTMAADDLWMSPAYEQDLVCLHFTWIKDEAAVEGVLPEIEAALAPFAPRPHWGKVFTMSKAEIRPRYARLPDFERLIAGYDPDGKFRNPFLDRVLLD